MPNIKCEVTLNGWPTDSSIFEGADCIVMYCDGGGGHMVNQHLDQVDALAKKGVGIVCIHYGVEVPKGPSGEKFLRLDRRLFRDELVGQSALDRQVSRSFPTTRSPAACSRSRSTTNGITTCGFATEMKGVTPILTALPPKETLSRGDGPHSGNPDVRRDVLEKKEPQHMAWAAEREGGGRGFGFTGGHDHWNWGEPNFRKVVLNAIVWCAKGEVPKTGVESPAVTLRELEANQD